MSSPEPDPDLPPDAPAEKTDGDDVSPSSSHRDDVSSYASAEDDVNYAPSFCDDVSPPTSGNYDLGYPLSQDYDVDQLPSDQVDLPSDQVDFSFIVSEESGVSLHPSNSYDVSQSLSKQPDVMQPSSNDLISEPGSVSNSVSQVPLDIADSRFYSEKADGSNSISISHSSRGKDDISHSSPVQDDVVPPLTPDYPDVRNPPPHSHDARLPPIDEHGGHQRRDIKHAPPADEHDVQPLLPILKTDLRHPPTARRNLGRLSIEWPGETGEKGGKVWRQQLRDGQLLARYQIRLLKRVSSGPVSTVYLADNVRMMEQRMGNPCKFAVRAMDWSTVPGEYRRSVYPKLMMVYESLPPHPNIVCLLERLVDGKVTYLLQEWCNLGSLHQALSPSGCLEQGITENTAREIMQQICQGLLFLKHYGLPHGRLTSQNVLLDTGLQVKLTDYGYPSSSCSNRTDDDFHLRFRAPEMLRGKPFTQFAADIWSLGVVMYFMLHSVLPYSKRDVMNLEHCIKVSPLRYYTTLSRSCLRLLQSLLTVNIQCRPSLEAVTSYPWLTLPTKWFPVQGKTRVEDRAERKDPGHGLTVALDSPSASTGSPGSPSGKKSPSMAGRGCLGSEADTEVPRKVGRRKLAPLTVAWNKSYVNQLCDSCLEKERELSSLKMRLDRYTDSEGRRKTLRVTTMFERHHTSPPSTIKVQAAGQVRSGEQEQAEHYNAVTSSPAHQPRDQIMSFRSLSEKNRPKFFKYYATVIPLFRRELHLPPVKVTGASMLKRIVKTQSA